jgi:hypothetical protein
VQHGRLRNRREDPPLRRGTTHAHDTVSTRGRAGGTTPATAIRGTDCPRQSTEQSTWPCALTRHAGSPRCEWGSRSRRYGAETNRRDGDGWLVNRENAVLILPRMVRQGSIHSYYHTFRVKARLNLRRRQAVRLWMAEIRWLLPGWRYAVRVLLVLLAGQLLRIPRPPMQRLMDSRAASCECGGSDPPPLYPPKTARTHDKR